MEKFHLSAIGYSLLINEITNASRVCYSCHHFNGECVDFAAKRQCKALPSDAQRYSEVEDETCIKVVDTITGIVAAKFYNLPDQLYHETRLRYTTYCRLTREEMGFSEDASDDEYADAQDKYITEFEIPQSAMQAYIEESGCYDSISDFNSNWTWDDAELLYGYCRFSSGKSNAVIKEITKAK